MTAVKSGWGNRLEIIVSSGARYLPGAYAVYNSAVLSGFKGRFHFRAMSCQPHPAAAEALSSGPVQFLISAADAESKHNMSVQRINGLPHLPEGDYVMMGADFIFERPCGAIFEALEDGLVLSPEPDPKWTIWDVQYRRQMRVLGLEYRREPGQYFNADFIGFRLPRDREFVAEWVRLASEHVAGSQVLKNENDLFPFVEQDVLNCLIRSRLINFSSISVKRLEFSSYGGVFQERPFPWTAQAGLRPVDQLKFLIHGAALRRPWLDATAPGWRGHAESLGLSPWRRKVSGRLTPYERAWAYYTCSPDLPIPIEAWAEDFGFSAWRSPLWRAAYGVK